MAGEYVADPTVGLLMQLVPLMVLQLLYAVVTFQLCSKQRWNAWILTLVVLIPVIGMIAFIVIFLTTLLKTLDRLNVLEGKGG